MLSALTLPRILVRYADRTIMLTAATFLAAVLGGFALVLFAKGWAFAPATSTAGWITLLATLALVGINYSATQTPSGPLRRRSAHTED